MIFTWQKEFIWWIALQGLASKKYLHLEQLVQMNQIVTFNIYMMSLSPRFSQKMKLYKLYLALLLLISYGAIAQESIGVAAAVNQNTSDLTLDQERKLVEAGYKIIQNHTIET